LFKCNALFFLRTFYGMSLNRYEQALCDYLNRQAEERRHWQQKVIDATRRPADPAATSRFLERDLWDYFVERSRQVPALRDLNAGGLRRVSMQNLAEYLLRVWGPPPKPKK
jgi:hypothetical protein